MASTRHAVVVAGGKGLRMGHDVPKQFMLLAGKPILWHTLHAFAGLVKGQLVLVLPADQLEHWQRLCHEHPDTPEHLVATGGSSRHASCRAGILALRPYVQGPDDRVAIHDGARPLVRAEAIERVFAAAAEEAVVAVAAVKPKDSLRQQSAGRTVAVDRSQFWVVQTPQVVRYGTYVEAMQTLATADFSDDASFLEAAGHAVVVVPGDYDNLKVTTPDDMLVAEAILAQAATK